MTPAIHRTPEGLQLPVTLLPAALVLPRRYVLHKHSQLCANCQTKHEWTQLYAFNEMMTRTGSGKAVMNLVPVSEFKYNLPIEVVTLAPRSVPVCHECPDKLSLGHLPDPRDTDAWRRHYHSAPAPEMKKRTPGHQRATPTKTLDDLLDL